MWGKARKNKSSVVGDASSADSDAQKPERTSNKLDHVLVAENKQHRTLFKHRKRALIALLALTIVVAGGGAAWYFRNKNASDQQNKDFQALISNIKTLRDEGKDGEAQNQLIQFDKKYPNQTKEQRYRVASELATIYKTRGDFQSALEWQQIAYDNNPNPGYADYVALGEAYTLNKNNAEAIKYLQLALDALKKIDNAPDGGPRGRFIQNQINLLQGKGGEQAGP